MSTNIQFENGKLTVKRIYDAPIEEVFDAWIETSKVGKWWGCAECTHVESEIEPRKGGKYNHLMTIDTPMGEHKSEQFATLIEFDPPHRLSYRSIEEGDPMVITVDFQEMAGGTEVTLVHENIPDMKVDGDQDLSDVIRGGWTAAFGKLGGFLTPAEAA